MDVEKLLKQTQDQSLYTNWQGGIFALEKIKTMIISNIDAEIFKLKNLSNSTTIGETLNRVEAKTIEAMSKEEVKWK